MKTKHHFFTLLELMLTLALMGLLLSLLFASVKTNLLLPLEVKKEKQTIAIEKNLFSHLSSFFDQADDPNLFYTSSKQPEGDFLAFTFDHGPSEDPLFSGSVLAELYIDPNIKALCLAVWPNMKEDKKIAPKLLRMAENVIKMDFTFYDPPIDGKKVVEAPSFGTTVPLRGWSQSRPKNAHKFPALFKILITFETDRGLETCSYPFDFSNKASHIIYSGIEL